MELEDNRPKWLLELENRKRKPRLAHEVGAGVPCMKCSTACPGLDLHFWRKICKICKCSRDDHDVPNDEFPQFDLLFGPSGKPNRKMIVLKVNKKQSEDEATFEWAPPNTTRELAADYMKALPEDKLPIKGTAGAALRKQQLQRQLPLHDIDHKVCDELSESERKQFEKYLENLKKYVGQGKVTKALGARPFNRSLMTPANATDMNRFSPKHKQIQSELGNSPNLRTPSSFVLKVSHPNNQSEASNISDTGMTNSFPRRDARPVSTVRIESVRSPSIIENAVNVDSPQGRYHRVLTNVRNNGLVTNSSPINGIRNSALNLTRRVGNVEHRGSNENDENRILHDPDFETGNNIGFYHGTSGKPGNQELANSSSLLSENLACSSKRVEKSSRLEDFDTNEENRKLENSLLAERILNEALLPPSAVNVGDIIGSTLSEKGLSLIREKLASKYSGAKLEPFNVQTPTSSRSLSNDKPDLYKRIDQTRGQGILDETKQRNDVTSDYFDNDHELQNNRNTDDSSVKNIGRSCETQNPLAFDKRVSNNLGNAGLFGRKTNDVVIKGITDTEPCRNIVRGICDDYLSKSVNSKNHNDPTTSTKSLNAEFMNYGLGNTSIVNSEDLTNPVFPEYTSVTSGVVENPIDVDRIRGAMEELSVGQSQTCHQCRESVQPGDVVVTAEKANDAFWHPGCFVCSVCNELLADLVYFYYKGRLYCGRDLPVLLEIPRCFACDELIFVREYTVAEGHNYHVKHFCCWDCDMPLAGQQYISENDRPLCLPCYQRTYAKTCRTCNGLIAADQQGVAVKNLNFHANDQCFSCATCKKSLLNGKMAIKENRPFCTKECIAKFLNELVT